MRLSDGQIRAAFAAVVGFRAREADVQAIQLLGATDSAMADYIWDHWLGEPDEPTVAEVQAAIRETTEEP